MSTFAIMSIRKNLPKISKLKFTETKLRGENLPKHFEKSETFYIKYVHCPRCGEGGQLNAQIQKVNGKWYGPYYFISHKRTKFDPVKYHLLMEKGLKSYAIKEASPHFSQYVRYCYLGKVLPPVLKAELEEKIARIFAYISDEDNRHRRLGLKGQQVNRMLKTCPICGVKFQVLPSYSNVVFCSKECAVKAKDSKGCFVSLRRKTDTSMNPALEGEHIW
jgi:hypothetical protein